MLSVLVGGVMALCSTQQVQSHVRPLLTVDNSDAARVMLPLVKQTEPPVKITFEQLTSSANITSMLIRYGIIENTGHLPVYNVIVGLRSQSSGQIITQTRSILPATLPHEKNGFVFYGPISNDPAASIFTQTDPVILSWETYTTTRYINLPTQYCRDCDPIYITSEVVTITNTSSYTVSNITAIIIRDSGGIQVSSSMSNLQARASNAIRFNRVNTTNILTIAQGEY